MTESKYGLYITRTSQRGTWKGPDREEHHFEVTFGKLDVQRRRKNNLMFVTNPTAHAHIKKYQEAQKFEGNSALGSVDIDVDHPAKLITTTDYYPIGYKYYVRHGLVFAPNPELADKLRKTGIAGLVELQIEKTMQKLHPGYSIKSTTTPTLDRVKQLEGRGRTPGMPIPVGEAIALSKKYLIEKSKAQKKK